MVTKAGSGDWWVRHHEVGIKGGKEGLKKGLDVEDSRVEC